MNLNTKHQFFSNQSHLGTIGAHTRTCTHKGDFYQMSLKLRITRLDCPHMKQYKIRWNKTNTTLSLLLNLMNKCPEFVWKMSLFSSVLYLFTSLHLPFVRFQQILLSPLASLCLSLPLLLHPLIFPPSPLLCVLILSLRLLSYSRWKSSVCSSPPDQTKMKVSAVCWHCYLGNASPVCSPSASNEQLLTRKHLLEKTHCSEMNTNRRSTRPQV